jgi:flavin reductase (DIM6/NTAB) family NADH-FMN oxidoreductase RutF
MGIDQADFKRIMGSFLSGVTVVTTAWQGRFCGITVSAFASLSLEPTLVLISINHEARSHAAIGDAKLFVVNILAEHQQELSVRFAAQDDGHKFDGLAYRLGKLGAPVLDGALAHAECQVVEALPGGDHTIFVGEVVAGGAREGLPLGYYRGAYRRLRPD